jgi:Poly A polymerase head domain.
VRDLLLAKKEFKDIDFVVEGSGIDFANKLDDALKQEGRLIVFDDFDTARYLFIEQKEEDIKDEENQEENERVNQKKFY